MSDDFDLVADYREDTGKGSSRRLRRQGLVPAIIYGAGRPPRALTFDHNKVVKQLENESFYSSVLNVKVGEKSQAVILKDMQRHPAKNQIMHIDLQRIVADQEIKMNVPIHFLNEDIAVGVKQGGGKVSHLMNEVEVVCLPKHLPEYLDIDIADLELDAMLMLSDIPVPEGVTITALAQDPPADQPIVNIHVIKEVVIEEPEELEGIEGEVPSAEVPVVGEEEESEEPTEE